MAMRALLIGLSVAAILCSPAVWAEPVGHETVEQFATRLVQEEDLATMRRDTRALAQVFVQPTVADGAYRAALERSAYIADWANARRIRFDAVAVRIRADQVHWISPTQVAVSGADLARYRYHHLVGNTAECAFGLGVHHAWVFKEVKGRWLIQSDKFIDPLNQDTRLQGAAVPAVIQVKPELRSRRPPNAGAKKALEFAQNYCGSAPGCGHQNQYHQDYEDFGARGGDCSNFISQVLHAGGFAKNSQWSWGPHGGTDTWINASRLAQYLRRSGRATMYAEGSMTDMLSKDSRGVDPLSQLRLGDLIGYFETGRVVHMAVLVGFDADGYPLVVSHSADRYRVPWDLGWDRNTRYLLFHVHYPSVVPEARPAHDSPKTMMSPVRIR